MVFPKYSIGCDSILSIWFSDSFESSNQCLAQISRQKKLHRTQGIQCAPNYELKQQVLCRHNTRNLRSTFSWMEEWEMHCVCVCGASNRLYCVAFNHFYHFNFLPHFVNFNMFFRAYDERLTDHLHRRQSANFQLALLLFPLFLSLTQPSNVCAMSRYFFVVVAIVCVCVWCSKQFRCTSMLNSPRFGC